MTLPTIKPPTDKYDLDGEKIEIRSLTREEAFQCQRLIGTAAEGEGIPWNEVEIKVIAYGTGTPEEEVRKWYASAPVAAVEGLVEAIRVLSKLDGEGAHKS